MTIIGSSVGGLIVLGAVVALLLHRLRKSDAGSYMVPWDSAKTAGVLSYIGKKLQLHPPVPKRDKLKFLKK